MPTPDENILNGVDPNEDAMIEDMLKQDVSQRVASPKVEVVSMPVTETLLVHIPAGNPNAITVTPVEKTVEGKWVTKAATRPASKAEVERIRAGKHEVISGPGDDAPVANPEQKRPWWHWVGGAIGATAAVAVAVVAVRHYTGAGQEVEFEEVDEVDDDEGDEE